MSTPGFELLLFADTRAQAEAAGPAGIDGLVVDWEWRGKDVRQVGFDTQINRHTVAHLHAVRAATETSVTCRTNAFGPWTADEIDAAVDGGADEILLPMVRTPDEVLRTADLVRGRCRLGILVETVDALNCAEALGRLPLSRVFAGLNDLAIERRTPDIFQAIVDGTIDGIRPYFGPCFGFGGLTRPDLGFPMPCRILIEEMIRLRCSFSFLRRSFLRDVPTGEFPLAVERIHRAIAEGRRAPGPRAEAADAAAPVPIARRGWLPA